MPEVKTAVPEQVEESTPEEGEQSTPEQAEGAAPTATPVPEPLRSLHWVRPEQPATSAVEVAAAIRALDRRVPWKLLGTIAIALIAVSVFLVIRSIQRDKTSPLHIAVTSPQPDSTVFAGLLQVRGRRIDRHVDGLTVNGVPAETSEEE